MADPNDDRANATTRRTVLEAAGASSAAGVAAALFASGVAAQPTVPQEVSQLANEGGGGGSPAEVFPQSVASGGPTPTGVILWTRVHPDAVRGQAPIQLEVAETEALEDARRFRLDPPSRDHDYTVRVDLDGLLEPDTTYYYRFTYAGTSSRVGRSRTLPEPDASPDSLRLAVATCNNYLQGLFPAYGHIAREEDNGVHYLVHLGDLIYENGGTGRHGRSIDLPSGHGQAWTLEDFRTLHRTYRGDANMQEALRRHTLIHTWDDHEIVNNRWWNYETDAPETASHPRGDDPEFMRELYARGIQALTEYLPLRASYDPDAETAQDAFTLYRSFQFGDLAELFMTDERLYRVPPPEDEFGRRDFATPPSRAQDDEGRSMLGETQRDWLVDGVRTSGATWKLWGNEVLNAALKIANAGAEAFYINYDAWDGYEWERRQVMDAFHGDVENLVTLTGDMHTYVAAYLKLEYKDATQSEHVSDEGRVGVELMTPAISSDNLADSGLFPPAREEQTFDQGAQTQNPHIEWINSNNYGYCVVEFTGEACTYSAYAVDRTVDDPEAAGKELLRRFRVPEGEIELREVAGDDVPEADGSDVRDAAGGENESASGESGDPVEDLQDGEVGMDPAGLGGELD